VKRRRRGRYDEDDLFTKPSRKRWNPEELLRSVKYVFDEKEGKYVKRECKQSPTPSEDKEV